MLATRRSRPGDDGLAIAIVIQRSRRGESPGAGLRACRAAFHARGHG
jgi:hypothetical protein